jgi:hypothetical protein
MGWASRANPRAQAKQAGQLAPPEKPARPLFKQASTEKAWNAFFARLLKAGA